MQPAVLQALATPSSDDGDALRICTTCAFAGACRAEGYDKSALLELHCLVEHVGPFHAGDHLFREGDPFTAIAAVRAGENLLGAQVCSGWVICLVSRYAVGLRVYSWCHLNSCKKRSMLK